jgi:hypothetical protein
VLGAETIIHMVESVLEFEPTYVVVKVDFKNAFNSIFRAKLLDAIKRRVPGMHTWAAKNHVGKTFLWHKCTAAEQVECDSIFSEEGVQQGEVCGPTNFCLVLQDLIVETNALLQSMGGGFLWGYMDDLTLLAPMHVVESIWPEFVRSAAQIGLVVNMSKCVLYTRNIIPAGVVVNMPGDMIRSEDGFEMTGVPIGTDQFKRQFWSKQFAKIEEQIDTACAYDDSQVALLFLSKCIATKLNYYTRLTNPTSEVVHQLSARMDKALCGGLSLLLKKHPFSTESKFWLQARLSAKHGGLGIHSPVVNQPGAHLASLISCMQLIREQSHVTGRNRNTSQWYADAMGRVVETLKSKCQSVYDIVLDHSVVGESQLEPLSELMDGSTVKLQKKLTAHVSNRFYKELFDSSLTEDQLRLDSCGAEGGVLVTFMPKYHHFRMEPEHFVERICTRLGMRINYVKEGVCVHCTNWVDAFGYHLQSGCNHGDRRFKTHDAIKNTWCVMGNEAGYRSHTESSDILRAANKHKTDKRMDVVLECYDGALPLLGDVSVADPRALPLGQYVNGESRKNDVGTAASKAEARKYKDYEELCPVEVNATRLCEFKPLIFESFGRWGDDARTVFKHLVERIVKRSGLAKSTVSAYWRARLCFAMHKTAAYGTRKMAFAQAGLGPQRSSEELNEVDWEWLLNCKA